MAWGDRSGDMKGYLFPEAKSNMKSSITHSFLDTTFDDVDIALYTYFTNSVLSKTMLPFIRNKEENKQKLQMMAQTLLYKDGDTEQMGPLPGQQQLRGMVFNVHS